MSLCFSSSRLREVLGRWLVEAAVSDHRKQDVEPTAGETDDCSIVFFAFGAFVLVGGLGSWVVAGGHPGGPEQRILEVLIA